MKPLPTLRRVLLAVLLLLAPACQRGGPSRFDPSALEGPLVAPPLPKPELVLHDTEGRLFNLQRETDGFVTLLFFGYTSCPDRCPIQLANIAAGMRRLDSMVTSRIKVVFVTVDPKRDTPAVIRRYLDHFDPRFIGLTGDSASIASAFTQLRLGHPAAPAMATADSTSYTINHNVAVLAFTPDNLAHVAYLSSFHPAQWAHDLTLLAGGT